MKSTCPPIALLLSLCLAEFQPAHAQTASPPSPVPPDLSPLARSMIFDRGQEVPIHERLINAEEKPWLYLSVYHNDRENMAMKVIDSFQKDGILMGDDIYGIYSGPPLPELRSTIARQMLRLLAVRGMPICSWKWNNEYPFDPKPGFWNAAWTKGCFRTLINGLQPELAERGVTPIAAEKLVNQATSIDAIPQSHCAFFPMQEMHCAGILVGDGYD